MNTSLRLIILALFMFSLISCSSRVLTHRVEVLASEAKVAILPFADYLEANNSGMMTAGLFRIHLFRAGLEVVEREKIQQVLTEKELDLAGMSESQSQEFGTLLGADYLLTGGVTQYRCLDVPRKFLMVFEWTETTCSVGIIARLIRVRDGKVSWSGLWERDAWSLQEAAGATVEALVKDMVKPEEKISEQL